MVTAPAGGMSSFALGFRTDRALAIAPDCSPVGGLVDSRHGEERSLAISEGEIEELREEATALADRAKGTARQAEILADRIKDLEKQVVKKRPSTR